MSVRKSLSLVVRSQRFYIRRYVCGIYYCRATSNTA